MIPPSQFQARPETGGQGGPGVRFSVLVWFPLARSWLRLTLGLRTHFGQRKRPPEETVEAETATMGTGALVLGGNWRSL